MNVREWLNNNSAVATLVAVVVLVISLAILVYTGGGGSRVTEIDLYYYDLNTGELFTASSRLIPPIEAPSGPTPEGEPAGVRAYLYSCSDCDDESTHRIAWLERYTPEAKQRIENYRNNPEQFAEEAYYEMEMQQDHQVRRPEDNQWQNINTQAGQQIMEIAMQCPEGQRPQICYPDR